MTDRPASLNDTSNGGARAGIRAHIEKLIGPVNRVFRETDPLLDVDVLCVPAAIDRPVHMLFTAGMSDTAMTPSGNTPTATISSMPRAKSISRRLNPSQAAAEPQRNGEGCSVIA